MLRHFGNLVFVLGVFASVSSLVRPAAAASVIVSEVTEIPADADANRRASAAYDALLAKSDWFRNRRIRQECAGIESTDLQERCLVSFRSAARPTAEMKR